MKTSDFYYDLPKELIAQTPMEPRDHSRLLVFDSKSGAMRHCRFDSIIDFLHAGDALVINHTKTIPARLIGSRENGGAVEFLLLKRRDRDTWEALARPGRKLKPGDTAVFGNGLLRAKVIAYTSADGGRLVQFEYDGVFEEILDQLGVMPLPPYIKETLRNPSRYNTVYAKVDGSAATPTAGLHFTEGLLSRIAEKGVHIVPILLHVGLGTFRPVKVEDVSAHVMHEEYYEVDRLSADAINTVRANGGRVICVGTTSVRTLETVADEDGVIHAGTGNTDIFITPGFQFHATDALITNFHLPESTLLMLVSALMGKENMFMAYREAIQNHYRFFSFGDAMLIGEGLLADSHPTCDSSD